METRRHLIVSGGSRGLGEAIVRRMLCRGYRVSTCSRSKTDLIDEMSAHPDYGERFFWSACEVGVAGRGGSVRPSAAVACGRGPTASFWSGQQRGRGARPAS